MAHLQNTVAAMIAVAGLAHFAPARADIGPDTASLLNQMYQDTRQDCGSPSRPAFLCSGVLLRGTTPSTAYPFYGISPANQARAGVSASFLRKDAKFKQLAFGYKSGFIFDAVLDNPADHVDYNVLCAFPIDAGSNDRQQNGCGDSSRTTAAENFCDQMGIATAEQWLSRYRANGSSHAAQCSFDVRQGRGATANAFYQNLRAMNLLGQESFNENNELVLAPWPVDAPRSPSLLASFYVADTGIEGARLNQIQWYQAAKAFLPAIRMQLPATPQYDAVFSYVGRDQAIQPTTAADSCERYIESVRWTQYDAPKFNQRIHSMEIVPTACGRAVQESQTNNFFNELVGKHYLQPAWVNNPDNHASSIVSMRRQLVCQMVLARNAAKWTLEPIRSNVTHEAAVASGNCDYR